MNNIALIRCSFSAIGESRDAVIEELDKYERILLTESGGEPWVTIGDDIEKVGMDGRAIVDPTAWFYKGERQLVFAGPTGFGESKPQFTDGFRPQGYLDDEDEA